MPQLGKALLDVRQMSECPAVRDASNHLILLQSVLRAERQQAPAMIKNRRRIAPNLMHHRGPPQRMSDTRNVPDRFGEEHNVARLPGGLIRIPKKPQHYRPVAFAAYSRIMAAIDQSVQAMLLAVVECKGLEYVLPSSDEMRRR